MPRARPRRKVLLELRAEKVALYFPIPSDARQNLQHATTFIMPSSSAEFIRRLKLSGDFSCKAQTRLHEGLQ